MASTFITGSASALGQPQAFQNEDLDIYGKPRPKTIYQEPMKKHALYIGNMTWVGEGAGRGVAEEMGWGGCG